MRGLYGTDPAGFQEYLVERLSNPEVRVEEDIALLWAPYEFYRNGHFNHCGHDAIHLVRKQGQWLIAALVYTMSDKSAKLGATEVRLQID